MNTDIIFVKLGGRVVSAYWICPDCGHIIWNQDQCITEIPTHCDSYMQIVDEHLVPILKNLRKKGYETRFSCQGHFSYNKEFNVDGEIYEWMYIMFNPVSMSTSKRFNVAENDCVYPLDVCLKSANENIPKIVTLNKWLDLKYEWEMENDITLYYKNDEPIFKVDTINIRLVTDLESVVIPDAEVDLAKIRGSVYKSISESLERRPLSFNYWHNLTEQMEDGAVAVSITPRIWQRKAKKLGLDMSRAEDFLKFCKANAPSTIKRVSKKEREEK